MIMIADTINRKSRYFRWLFKLMLSSVCEGCHSSPSSNEWIFRLRKTACLIISKDWLVLVDSFLFPLLFRYLDKFSSSSLFIKDLRCTVYDCGIISTLGKANQWLSDVSCLICDSVKWYSFEVTMGRCLETGLSSVYRRLVAKAM